MPDAPPKPLEPSIGITFSKIKTGKTSDLLYAFGEDCVYVGRPGALSPSLGLVGRPIPEARIVRAANLDAITPVLEKAGGRARAVIVDDLTPLAAEHVRDYTYKRRGKPRLKGWKLWGRVREDFLTLRAAAMACTAKGTHVWFTAHERQPRTNPRKGFILGGPDLPGSMQEDFSAVCDYVLRAKYAADRPGWPYVYHGGPSSTWGLGDRYNRVGGTAPMNIAEIMRASGFDMPRGKGLEWIEAEVAERCAALVEVDPADWRAWMRERIPALVEAHGPQHARWILRDASDRAVLQSRGPLEQLAGFWQEAEPDASPADGAPSGDGLSDDVESEVAEQDTTAEEMGSEPTATSDAPAEPAEELT